MYSGLYLNTLVAVVFTVAAQKAETEGETWDQIRWHIYVFPPFLSSSKKLPHDHLHGFAREIGQSEIWIEQTLSYSIDKQKT